MTAMSMRLAKQQCCMCIMLFCTSLPSLHDYDVNMPHCTFPGGCEHKAMTLFLFSWTSIQSFRIQFQKKIANVLLTERVGISAIKFEAVF